MSKRRSANPLLCSVSGCDIRHYAKGYCKKHYNSAWYRSRVAAQRSETSDSSKFRVEVLCICIANS